MCEWSGIQSAFFWLSQFPQPIPSHWDVSQGVFGAQQATSAGHLASVWFTVIHYWRVAERWLLLISWSKQCPQSTVHFSLLWDLYTAWPCARCPFASKPQVSEISAIRIINFSFKLSQVPKLNFKQFPSSSKGGFIQFLIPHLLQDYLREMAIRAETLRHNRWEVRSFGSDWAGKRVGEGKMDGRTFGNGKMI